MYMTNPISLFLFHSAGEVDDESVASFVERRLGRHAVDYLLDPVLAGVYAGRVEQLSIKSVFPSLAALERQHGSLIKGALKRMTGGMFSNPRKTTATVCFFFLCELSRYAALIQFLLGSTDSP